MFVHTALEGIQAWSIVTGVEKRPNPPEEDEGEVEWHWFERNNNNIQLRHGRASSIVMASITDDVHPIISSHIGGPKKM
jgi:hypothetical protein